MLGLVVVCVIVKETLCILMDWSVDSDISSFDWPLRGPTLNLEDSYFASLENYDVGATSVTEKQYPWIARVIHSRTKDYPHICTAVCIEPYIFVTAARCLYTIKVDYTTIIYGSNFLQALAFVIPSDMSKQGFDDIGFIIVKKKDDVSWSAIQILNMSNRTDDAFKWFTKLDFAKAISPKVVGYSAPKGIHRIRIAKRHYNLTDLAVVVHLDLCSKILTANDVLKGFGVPCYHSCAYSDFIKSSEKCKHYHGVEGGVLFDTITKKLIGIATWGTYYSKYELPVGFAVPNSESFYKDYECAKRIRDDDGEDVQKGYFQSLCDV
ncbi:uncharacterized protein LOC142984075 [Anticarsia gemmatalis]|uniref:uncharacterized protein LOC142984075 n=1 Tax=Anticarsia gemmatalis TaxID=129554 RepID=UPI003F774C1D